MHVLVYVDHPSVDMCDKHRSCIVSAYVYPCMCVYSALYTGTTIGTNTRTPRHTPTHIYSRIRLKSVEQPS